MKTKNAGEIFKINNIIARIFCPWSRFRPKIIADLNIKFEKKHKDYTHVLSKISESVDFNADAQNSETLSYPGETP